VKKYSPDGTGPPQSTTKLPNCLSLANKQNENNYIVILQQDWQDIFLRNIVMFMLHTYSKS